MRLPGALSLVIVVVLTACGGGSPSAESVVRAWTEAVSSGDDEAAAKLFAPGARVVQAGQSRTLETRAEAVAFHASLSCSARIVAITEDGDTVTATFVLGHREQSRCDGRGAEVRTLFRVQEGKIRLWHQLPPGTAEPSGGGEV